MPGVRQTTNGVVQTASGVVQTRLSSAKVIEDWESGGLSENSWTGDTTNYTVTSGNAVEGSYYLEGEADYIKTAAAPNIPARGDYFKMLFSGTGRGDRFRIYWGPDVQGFGSGEHYMLYHDTDGYLRLYDAGPGDLLGEVSVDGSNITDGEWWEIHVDYGYSVNDEIEIFLYGTGGTLVTSLSVTDTTHSNAEDFGIRHQSQKDATYPQRSDYYHVNNEDQSQVL